MPVYETFRLEVLGFGDATLAELAAILFDESTLQLIALTRGAQGAVLLTRAGQSALPAPSDLRVVDTVGAGDCFHAGLIAYLKRSGKLVAGQGLERLDQNFLQCALRHAIAAASLNITRAGCDPATWEQTKALSHCV